MMYINDIDIELNNFVSKFADDTKIRKWLMDDRGKLSLPEDLRKISGRSERWEMPLMTINAAFYEWRQKTKNEYDMNGVKTESLQCVKDLVVTIALNRKFSQQCKDADGKANRMLGFINRNFFFRNRNIILPLYISLARLHLEHGVEIWTPRHTKDITKL